MLKPLLGILLLLPGLLVAAELSQVGQKAAEQASKVAQQTEAAQLQKAQAAAGATATREQAVLARQQQEPWEQSERQKAQQQFNERGQREAKYLQQAKEAAAKDHQMETPKMKIIKRKVVDN